MKTKLTIAIIICATLMSCKKGHHYTEIGNGFEIYLTEKLYTCNSEMDYSSIDFDTISLSKEPILRYDDLISYDSATHKLTLGVSHDSLKIGDTGVYGSMFVVTIDKKPVYCGFKWSVISSIPCNWIFIQEPYEELDKLKDNELILSYSHQNPKDPRLDSRILDRLIKDGKIK